MNLDPWAPPYTELNCKPKFFAVYPNYGNVIRIREIMKDKVLCTSFHKLSSKPGGLMDVDFAVKGLLQMSVFQNMQSDISRQVMEVPKREQVMEVEEQEKEVPKQVKEVFEEVMEVAEQVNEPIRKTAGGKIKFDDEEIKNLADNILSKGKHNLLITCKDAPIPLLRKATKLILQRKNITDRCMGRNAASFALFLKKFI